MWIAGLPLIGHLNVPDTLANVPYMFLSGRQDRIVPIDGTESSQGWFYVSAAEAARTYAEVPFFFVLSVVLVLVLVLVLMVLVLMLMMRFNPALYSSTVAPGCPPIARRYVCAVLISVSKRLQSCSAACVVMVC